MTGFALSLDGDEYRESIERRIDELVACWRDMRDRPHDLSTKDRLIAVRNDAGFCPPTDEPVRLRAALNDGDYYLMPDGQMFDQHLVDRLVARLAESGDSV